MLRSNAGTLHVIILAQSTGVAEYTDCPSAEG